MARKPRKSSMPLFDEMEQASKQKKLADLKALEKAALEAVTEAEEDVAPYNQAFWNCTDIIRQLLSDRDQGVVVTKDELMAAYDRRMEAGVERNPFKKALQEAERFYKAVTKELKEAEGKKSAGEEAAEMVDAGPQS